MTLCHQFLFLWMTSSRERWWRNLVEWLESDCQCQNLNSPGSDPSILRHSGRWSSAEVRYIKKAKKFPLFLSVFRIWIRIRRIRIFLGLPDPDPDPLVRGMDPDPDLDPSIQAKNRKTLIPAALWLFTSYLFFVVILKVSDENSSVRGSD